MFDLLRYYVSVFFWIWLFLEVPCDESHHCILPRRFFCSRGKGGPSDKARTTLCHFCACHIAVHFWCIVSVACFKHSWRVGRFDRMPEGKSAQVLPGCGNTAWHGNRGKKQGWRGDKTGNWLFLFMRQACTSSCICRMVHSKFVSQFLHLYLNFLQVFINLSPPNSLLHHQAWKGFYRLSLSTPVVFFLNLPEFAGLKRLAVAAFSRRPQLGFWGEGFATFSLPTQLVNERFSRSFNCILYVV